jgi:hypothetical protein
MARLELALLWNALSTVGEAGMSIAAFMRFALGRPGNRGSAASVRPRFASSQFELSTPA